MASSALFHSLTVPSLSPSLVQLSRLVSSIMPATVSVCMCMCTAVYVCWSLLQSAPIACHHVSSFPCLTSSPSTLSLSFLSILLHLLLVALNLMQLSLFYFLLLLLLSPPSPSRDAHPVHQWSEEVISLQSQERVQTQPDSQQGQWALNRKTVYPVCMLA